VVRVTIMSEKPDECANDPANSGSSARFRPRGCDGKAAEIEESLRVRGGHLAS